MYSEKPKYDVYVDVDTLFDSRLPTLYAIDDKSILNMLENDTYHTRVKDEFGSIPLSVFKGFYNNRDKRTLMASQPTAMFNLITEYVLSTITNMNSIGNDDMLHMYINTYPYDLLDSEFEVIKNLFVTLSERLVIHHANDSISELTPNWINSNVGVIIKYDMLDWTEYHVAYGNLTKTPLLNVMAMGPKLISGSIVNTDIEENSFKVILESLGTLIGFNFIRVDYFCIHKSDSVEKENTT